MPPQPLVPPSRGAVLAAGISRRQSAPQCPAAVPRRAWLPAPSPRPGAGRKGFAGGCRGVARTRVWAPLLPGAGWELAVREGPGLGVMSSEPPPACARRVLAVPDKTHFRGAWAVAGFH